MMKAPASRPAVPIPATARPTISIVDETAVAQSTDPRKEKPLATKNTLLMEKSLYALPYRNWKEHWQSRKAIEYQPMSATVWKWSVIVGTAVATMLMSIAPRIITAPRLNMRSQNFMPVGY